jgi:hypothetical protein
MPTREGHDLLSGRDLMASLSILRGTPRGSTRWTAWLVKVAPVTPSSHFYRLRVEDQAGARELLEKVGALAEIEQAVIAYCSAHAPNPPYRPQEIKAYLAPMGWIPEIRVPPFDAKYDGLPINDRYDIWKRFELDGEPVGVAIEMERWEVWTDLLKFRRGLSRGQIAVGLILHDCPANLAYVYQHLRLISEPLFGSLPIAFAAPEGEGLMMPHPPSGTHFAPYRMPHD